MVLFYSLMKRFSVLVLLPFAALALSACEPADGPDALPDVTVEDQVVEAPVETPAEEGQSCGGIAGLPCGEGEYCQMAEGTCNIADNMGVCMPQHPMCTKDYRPVCGCDGRTYGNACSAAAEGVSVSHQGSCEV